MSVSITHRQTTTRTVTTRTPKAVVEPRAPLTSYPKILWASHETWPSIESWGTNTADSWLHPVSSKTFLRINIGETIPFKFKGDLSKDCTVEVLHKSTSDEYENFKKIKMFGPFTAEAAFPWVKDGLATCLVHVKKV